MFFDGYFDVAFQRQLHINIFQLVALSFAEDSFHVDHDHEELNKSALPDGLQQIHYDKEKPPNEEHSKTPQHTLLVQYKGPKYPLILTCLFQIPSHIEIHNGRVFSPGTWTYASRSMELLPH